jgi:hypothetical protein
LHPGDTLDFWRVETFEPERLLRLGAEMKLPGRAWLEFEGEGETSGSTIRQTAIFDPMGLAGLLLRALSPGYRQISIFSHLPARPVQEAQLLLLSVRRWFEFLGFG